MALGGGGGNIVERLLVELGVDPSQLLSGVDKATGQAAQNVEQMGSRSSAVMSKIAAAAAIAGAAVIGIFSIKTITDSIAYTQQYGDAVRKLARETGMSTEASSDMLFAFQHVNLDSDAASRSLGILAKKLKGVQDEETGVTTGGKSTAQILADIGVQALDSEGNLRPLSELIPQIADYFQTLPDGVEKTGLAMQLFGRSGKDMIPLLNLGSEGMAELAAEAKKLGLELSPENAEQIKQYGFATRTMHEALGGLKLVIGVALIPLLTRFNNMLTSLQPVIRVKLAGAVQWLNTNLSAFLKYIAEVVRVGRSANKDFFAALPPNLAVIAEIIGKVILNLITLGEWTLKIAGLMKDWIAEIVNFLAPAKDMDGLMSALAPHADLVAAAITAFLAALIVATVISFATAVGGLALSFLLFPVREIGAAATAVANFVSAAVGLVSKAVTITQNVVTTGAEIIRSLPWMTQEITQLVKRTGQKWIDDFTPKTQEVTQNVTAVKVTPPTVEVKKSAMDIGVKFAQGIAQGAGAVIGGLLLTAIIAGLAFLEVTVGWEIELAIIGGIIAVALIGALAAVFREKIAVFFSGPFVKFWTEALPQFAASVPGWAGAVAGFVAGALIFALLGVPALIIKGLVEGVKRLAPTLGKGLAGAFKGALALVPWGDLVTGLGGAIAAIPGLLGKWKTETDKIPGIALSALGHWKEFTDKIPALLLEAVEAVPGILAKLPGIIGDAVGAIPGLIAGIPGFFEDVFGAIPGIATGALTGAGGLVGVITGAMGDVIGAIMATPIGQAVSWFVGQLVEGFKSGWSQVNEITGGALNDVTGKAWEIVEGVVGAIATLPGRLAGLAGDLFSGALGLGDAIFDGIMSGLKAVPEALGDLTGAILAVFKTAINAGINAINAVIPDKLGVSIMGHWIGFDIPDNPIPTLDFDQGGIVPGPIGAPVLAMVHGGEEILRADQRQGPQFNFAWAFQGYDWDAIRRAMHAEADRALDEAMGQAERRTYLAGSPLSSYVG